MRAQVEVRRIAPLGRNAALALIRKAGAAVFEGWSDEPGWRVILPWPERIVELAWGDASSWLHAVDQLNTDVAARPDTVGRTPFLGGWVGLIAYDLGAAHEAAAFYDENPPEPPLWFARHDAGIVVDPDGTHALFAPQTTIETRLRELDDLLRDTGRGVPEAAPRGNAGHPTVADSLDGGRYGTMVEQIREAIARGDVYQVNLTRRFGVVDHSVDPAELYLALTGEEPPRCSAFLRGAGWSIASASPEVFLRFDQGRGVAESRPIKGTIARRGDDEGEIAALLASRKDDSEHLMIVDLVRNDLGRVAPPGRVTVPAFKSVRSLRHVHHLESTVRAEGLHGRTLAEILAALFPAGSITGAPKRAAVHEIRELEPVPRGVYTGTIALLGDDGRSEWSVAIRTAVATGEEVRYHAGGGIVWDSDAAAEDAECRAKAVAFLDFFGETE